MAGSEWVLCQMLKREQEGKSPWAVDAAARMLPSASLAAAYLTWFWIAGPVHSRLGPALHRMVGRAKGFPGAMVEDDADGDGLVSLAELQAGAQAPIVAESPEAFARSRQAWMGAINAVQFSFRVPPAAD